jgi:DNA polymerase phi
MANFDPTAHDTDSEMSDLDDDQMMEFDAKLSEVFRNRKSFKAEKRDALKAMLDFKLRTIDLLEIFIKKQPANPLVLEIIMPALDALRTVCLCSDTN